jgi:hypothetical protein
VIVAAQQSFVPAPPDHAAGFSAPDAERSFVAIVESSPAVFRDLRVYPVGAVHEVVDPLH